MFGPNHKVVFYQPPQPTEEPSMDPALSIDVKATRGQRSIIVQLYLEGKLLSVGEAIKHPNDKFDTELGMHLALGRALTGLGNSYLKIANSKISQADNDRNQRIMAKWRKVAEPQGQDWPPQEPGPTVEPPVDTDFTVEWTTEGQLEIEFLEHGLGGAVPVLERPKYAKAQGAKLDEQDVKEIKELLRADFSYQEIARQYGISTQHVGNIANGLRWKHIE